MSSKPLRVARRVADSVPLPPIHRKAWGIIIMFIWMVASVTMNVIYLGLAPADVKDSRQYQLLIYFTVDKMLIAVRMVSAAYALMQSRERPTNCFIVLSDLALLVSMFANVAILFIAFLKTAKPDDSFFGTVYGINLGETCLISAVWVLTIVLHWREACCGTNSRAAYATVA